MLENKTKYRFFNIILIIIIIIDYPLLFLFILKAIYKKEKIEVIVKVLFLRGGERLG